MIYINTPRLILRSWRKADLKPFSDINKDLLVNRYLPGPYTNEQSERFIEKVQQNMEHLVYGLFACEEKKSGDLIGFVGLSIPTFTTPFTPCVEIGWRLGSQYWGQGYATEAARYVLEKAFTEYDLQEIVSFTVPENTPSRRVMEKLGMVQDVANNFNHPNLPLDHKLSKHVLYRLTRQQYREKFKKVVIEPYNNCWPSSFATETKKLKKLLKNDILIHHIGSTSIPGMSAKPIIDILIGVNNLADIDFLNEQFLQLGYTAHGENGIKGRRFFTKGVPLRTHNLHIFAKEDSDNINRHLAFRDYLIHHPMEAEQYKNLKLELAKLHGDDPFAYWSGKDPFIQETEQKAIKWNF